MRKLVNYPEVVLIVLGLIWIIENVLATGRVSYVTLLVTWLLFLQIIYKNRICGLLYGSGLAAISAYKLYESAILVIQDSAVSLLPGSFVIFGVSFIMSAALFVKYFKTKERYEQSVLTVSS